jgi:hypothetical protein
VCSLYQAHWLSWIQVIDHEGVDRQVGVEQEVAARRVYARSHAAQRYDRLSARECNVMKLSAFQYS